MQAQLLSWLNELFMWEWSFGVSPIHISTNLIIFCPFSSQVAHLYLGPLVSFPSVS